MKLINNAFQKLNLWLFIVFTFQFNAFGQIIKVIDKDSGKPIEHVTVYTENGSSILTDRNGLADLSGFKKYNVLYFQHPAYVNKSIPKLEASEEIFIVDLTERVINIEEIVISANKWEQSKEEISNKIISISPKATAFNNPQTSADLLSNSGEVFVQKSQLGGGSPIIRGFAANSVLIVVDGIRMNNAIFRSGNLQNIISIDPNVLESAEVVFGPGSVIYGSDALGGVMNFQTKKPQFSTTGKLLSTGSTFIRTSSANKEKTFHGHINLAGNKLSALTSITIGFYDNLRTGSKRPDKFPDFGKRKSSVIRIGNEDHIVTNNDVNIQVPSGYDQLNLLQKFQYKFNKNIDLSYQFNFSTTSDIPRYDRLIEVDNNGLPASAEWYYGPQKWMLNSIQAEISNGDRLFDRANLILGYQTIEESRNSRDYQDPELKVRTENVDVFSGNFDFVKELNDRSKLYYGFEGLYNKVNSAAIRRNIDDGSTGALSTRYPSGGSDYTSLASYASIQRKLNDKLNFNAGLRYSFVRLTAKIKEEDDIGLDFDRLDINNGALNGSMGLVFIPKESWQLDWVASTGFRSPNIDDVGKLFEGSNGILTVPNPDLKPEYAYNTEVSVIKTINNRIRIGVTSFVTYLDNAMVRRDFSFNGQDSIEFEGELSRVQALVNSGSALIYGGSLKVLWEINNALSFSSSITCNTGKDLSDDEPLRHTTPLFTKSKLVYNNNQFKAEIALITNAKREFEDLAPSERAKPHLYTEDGTLAWQTLNFKAGYNINNIWHVTGGVDNIFDLHYRPYSSGISAPGRNFYLALRLNF